MKKSFITASNLRTLLVMLFLVTVVVYVGGFYYAQDWLRTYANDIQNKNIPLKTISLPDQNQKQIKDDVTNHKKVSDKAAGLISSSNFQNEIKRDIDNYAKNTNITISGYELSSLPDAIDSPASISGINTKYLKITLENPVLYTNLYKFIKAIETNIPKINLKGINIKLSENSNGNVDVEPLIIEVYTR